MPRVSQTLFCRTCVLMGVRTRYEEKKRRYFGPIILDNTGSAEVTLGPLVERLVGTSNRLSV